MDALQILVNVVGTAVGIYFLVILYEIAKLLKNFEN